MNGMGEAPSVADHAKCTRWIGQLLAEAVWKLKKSKRDENDILGFDLKIEWACGVSAESGL